LKESGVRVFASGQSIDVDSLRMELGAIRSQGFAVSSGERLVGTAAVAAPVFGLHKQVAGSISTGGPSYRFGMEIATDFGALVSSMAKKLSADLGAFSQGAQAKE